MCQLQLCLGFIFALWWMGGILWKVLLHDIFHLCSSILLEATDFYNLSLTYFLFRASWDLSPMSSVLLFVITFVSMLFLRCQHLWSSKSRLQNIYRILRLNRQFWELLISMCILISIKKNSIRLTSSSDKRNQKLPAHHTVAYIKFKSMS